ncbi:MAG TPA: diguanylate cyclase, partial [Conexibacter sp.]|nr:diguanylate cyclase [Conexibacter sp.]
TIPAADLAAEGPAVCAALARALGSDAELDRLRPDGDLAPLAEHIPALAGARDVPAALAAVDALRACLWAAALDARGARTDTPAPLAERLAEVALVVAGTALAALGSDALARPADDRSLTAGREGEGAAARQAPAADADRAGGGEDARPPAGRPVGAPGWAGPDQTGPARQTAGPADVEATTAATGPGSVTHLPQRPPGELGTEMDDGDLWIATLERHVDRAQREGGGLALLRVELVDGERLAASMASDPDADDRGVPYGRLAQAIRRAIRRQDLVASDRQGRAWVIAPAVGRAGAVALAERIGAGVEHGEHWRGAPLAATIGFAVYGEDGSDAATLIDRAEEAMLAASAAGVRIGDAGPAPADGGDDGTRGPRLVR